MISHLTVFGSSLLIYGLLCISSLFVGLGLISVLRIRPPSQMRFFLAPVMTFTFWSVVPGIGGALGCAVESVAPWLWATSIILMFVGAWSISLPALFHTFPPRNQWAQRRETLRHMTIRKVMESRFFRSPSVSFGTTLLFSLCVVLPVVVMFRYFLRGIGDDIESIMTDGWSYIAIGQYMWAHARGTEGGLAPLYQFGSIFHDVRYISFSLLGFLSPLIRYGDTQSASSLMQAWTLFVLACSVALFWRAEQRRIWTAFLGITLAVGASWMANVVWADNFDHELALVYMPAIAAVAISLDSRRWSTWFLLGCLTAGALYTYPELAPAIIGGAFIIVLPRFWRERAMWETWLRGLAVTCITALVLNAPVLTTETKFFFSQLAQGTAKSGRPGEGIFAGLAERRFEFAAFWGLGGEFSITAHLAARNLAGLLLTILACLGLIILIRQRQWGLAVTAILLSVATLFFIVRQHYSYGAYKFLSLGWWTFAVAVVISLEWIIVRVRFFVARIVCGVLASLIVLLPVSQIDNHSAPENNYRHANSANRSLRADQYRQVQSITRVVGDQPVLVLVDDWLANEWAIYYLRDQPISVGAYRVYMNQPFSLPAMHRARVVPSDQLRYVLTDVAFNGTALHWNLAWSGGPYLLWYTDGTNWSTIAAITDSGGAVPLSGDQQFFWMTQSAVNVRVMAAHAGEVLLNGNFTLGPSLPGVSSRKVLVTTDSGYQQTVLIHAGRQSVHIPVAFGETVISLKALDTPTVKTLPNGDVRPLLLGVSNLQATFDAGEQEEVAQVAPSPSTFTFDVTFPTHPANTLEPLVTTGRTEYGDFVGVKYLPGDMISFEFIHWGGSFLNSPPISIEAGRTYHLSVALIRDASIVTVTMDDMEVFRVAATFHPTTAEQVTLGENRIGGAGAPSPRFSGTITQGDIR